jgi:exodeoxyribonuclease V alpha subunit
MLVIVTSIVSIRPFGSIFGAKIEEIEDQSHQSVGTMIRVKASAKVMLGQPVVGDVWDVQGSLIDTPAYGLQIDATRATRKMPTGKLITNFLAGHAPGVGPERAKALWEHFGVGIRDVLSDEANIPAIAAVIAPDRRNLAPQLAAACVREWKGAEAETRTLSWLDAHGIDDVQIARRVCQILGDTAIERLNANPYCLVPLLKWKRVDMLALKLIAEAGVESPTIDIRRLVGACDAVVKAHIKEGHTAGTLESLTSGLVKCLEVSAESTLISDAIAAGNRFGAILPVTEVWWRAPGCAAMEDSVQQRLREICVSKSQVKVPKAKFIEQFLLDARAGGHSLHQEQREAVLKVVLSPLACLQGGAGVGKTTTAKVICDLWEQFGGNLVLTAIAGKAALQLSRSTGRLAMTLARLRMQLEERESIESRLEGDLTPTERKRAVAKLAKLAHINDCSLVLVDEASMLDLTNANALMRFMPEGARLVLVGDEAQLPPVGFGLIYHRLVSDDSITARLTVIHRQSEATGIPVVAASVRYGAMPDLPEYCGQIAGVSFLEHVGPDLQSSIQKVWNEVKGADNMAPLIVTATNKGDAGVDSLNALLHGIWHQGNSLDEMKGHFGQWFSAGEPVVCLKNDYSKGLYNGLLGEIFRIEPDEGTLMAQFEGYDEPHRLDDMDLLDLQLAYAISCHRGQGSQAPVVIVPIYQSRMLDPSWLYTAITRAERQVVLIGSREVLADALALPKTSDRRMVGFTWK